MPEVVAVLVVLPTVAVVGLVQRAAMRVALLPLVGPPGWSVSVSLVAGVPEIGSCQYSPAALVLVAGDVLARGGIGDGDIAGGGRAAAERASDGVAGASQTGVAGRSRPYSWWAT